MNHKVSHIAIHVDDMSRAREFYRSLFHWQFREYGPPDFLQVSTSSKDGDELIGALQSRHYSPLNEDIRGMECTIRVPDIDVVLQRIPNLGGKILMPKTLIPQVGWIAKCLDTEGNLICVMEYLEMST